MLNLTRPLDPFWANMLFRAQRFDLWEIEAGSAAPLSGA
jgi:hypothetical protein